MQLHNGSLCGITASARDGVAIIHEAWQALLPAYSQPGADLNDLWSVYRSLCPTICFLQSTDVMGTPNLVEGPASVQQ